MWASSKRDSNWFCSRTRSRVNWNFLRVTVRHRRCSASGTKLRVNSRATSRFTKRSASGKSLLRPRGPRFDCACARMQRSRHPACALPLPYTGAIETAEEFGVRLYREAWQRGWSRAKRKVVLGDGAPWIWNLADEHFPGATQIVDLYHARQHLWELAEALSGEPGAAQSVGLQTPAQARCWPD
jgi:hypothetical protein